jgi:Mg2+-importing ATPase
MGEADLGLAAIAGLDASGALRALGAAANGLLAAEAHARLDRYGPNTIANERRSLPLLAFLAQFRRPLPLLLLALAAVDLATGQGASAAVIAAIVVLSSLLGFVQEYRSDLAVQRLRALVRTTVRVLGRAHRGQAGGAAPVECPIEDLVPGDILTQSAKSWLIRRFGID